MSGGCEEDLESEVAKCRGQAGVICGGGRKCLGS